MCIICQQTSPKRWFGSMNMRSNCDVANSAQQIQMTTICHWMNPPWKFSAYATVIIWIRHSLLANKLKTISMPLNEPPMKIFCVRHCNYLNTTFAFGKQTKNNFINRKVECRPTYLFTHFRAHFFFGEKRGAAPLGWPEIPHDQQHSRIVLLAPHQDGTKQGRWCSHTTWSLDELWAAFPWM